MQRYNPITKQYEDDGIPESASNPIDPMALDSGNPPVDLTENLQAGSGGGSTPVQSPTPLAAPTPEVVSSQPQLPAHESTKSFSQPVESKQAVAAEKTLFGAQAQVDKAAIANANADQIEADRQAKLQEQVIEKRKELQTQQWEQEQERKRRVDALESVQDARIEEEKKARLAIGKAPETFWEGRPIAKFFSNVLLAVSEVAKAGIRGPLNTEQTPAARVLDQIISDYTKKKVNAWEATKEANALRLQGEEKYSEELNRRTIAAHNDNIASIDILADQIKIDLMKLSPEKRKAAMDLAQATLVEKRAQERLARKDKLNGEARRSTTDRTDPSKDATGKPLTESEAKDMVFADSISQAIDNIKGKTMVPETLKALKRNLRTQKPTGFVGEWLKSEGVSPVPDGLLAGISDPAQKEIARNWLQYSENKSRKYSGAAIGGDEWGSSLDRNLPNGTDGPAQQRKLLREAARFADVIVPKRGQAATISSRIQNQIKEMDAPKANHPPLKNFTDPATGRRFKGYRLPNSTKVVEVEE